MWGGGGGNTRGKGWGDVMSTYSLPIVQGGGGGEATQEARDGVMLCQHMACQLFKGGGGGEYPPLPPISTPATAYIYIQSSYSS